MGAHAIALCGLFVLALTAVLAFVSPVTFGSCGWAPYNRVNNPDVQKTSLVSYQTRRLLVERVPQLFWVLVLILKAARTTWQKPRSLLAATLYFALWFPGILLVEALKVRSSDMHCSTRLAGNGISGHFFYFAWALASMILLQREIPTPVVPSFAILASLFAVQGYYTWAFGYHSLQQIFLGAGFGLLFASICWITAHKVIGKDNQ